MLATGDRTLDVSGRRGRLTRRIARWAGENRLSQERVSRVWLSDREGWKRERGGRRSRAERRVNLGIRSELRGPRGRPGVSLAQGWSLGT